MEYIFKDRSITPKFENNERRKYIIDNYKELIPDIENYVYEKKNKNFDYSFFVNDVKKNILMDKFNKLTTIVIDIRNNTIPTSYYSNSINKTDNKFSNESKNLIKILLAKGWTTNEIAYELEKIYGSGIITYNGPLIDDTPFISKFFFYSFKLSGYYLLFRLGKGLFLNKSFDFYYKKIAKKLNFKN